MSLCIRDAAGSAVQLAGEAFAQGGEAAVYAVPAYPSVVVKLYHAEVLKKRGRALQTKIEAMVNEPQFAAFKQHPGLAWPRLSVFDGSGQWRGYAMRKSNGVRMAVLAHAMAYRTHFPDLDRPALVNYLLDLLGTIRDLHAAGVMIGDYNPTNFLCDPDSSRVSLIDCDSWQVRCRGQLFACPVAAPDMLAPELLGKELASVPRSVESELFSLAILLFKLLMLGRHPFDVCGGGSPVDNIRKGHFPYGEGGGGIPKGPWYNIWSHLPYKLKAQLVHTFRQGAQNPAERTPVSTWIDLLTLYQRELEKRWHSWDIRPATPKEKTYRGAQTLSQPIVC